LKYFDKWHLPSSQHDFNLGAPGSEFAVLDLKFEGGKLGTKLNIEMLIFPHSAALKKIWIGHHRGRRGQQKKDHRMRECTTASRFLENGQLQLSDDISNPCAREPCGENTEWPPASTTLSLVPEGTHRVEDVPEGLRGAALPRASGLEPLRRPGR